MHHRTIDVLGVHVHDLRREELLHTLEAWAGERTGPGRRMFYTNAHVFNLAATDPEFRALLDEADLRIFDGFGGCLGAQLLGHGRPEQLAMMDWIDDFLARLALHAASIYLLGDEPGVAKRCGQAMADAHPGLRVVGTHHGFFSRTGRDARQVREAVRAAGPDVLLVGMGNPLQERWITATRGELEVPLALAMGAMFRWYVEVEPRAPAWMRRLHLEWLLRLVRHPVRHFRRYVVGNPAFLIRVLRQRLLAERTTSRAG